MAATWKTVRVFISSTFRDMQAERDHLVRFVFPRLRDQLLPRRIHLVDVDLRWGVTSEQDASEVCREIINECRPRFLCMLGGRYGWVPPGKTRSITADEVHFGILDRTLTDRGFAYFYFRDEAATTSMVETTAGEFREPQRSENESKLRELKQAIVDASLNPFTYPARWDNNSRRLTDLKTFGDKVYGDLLASMKSDPEVRDRFVTETAAQPDEFAEENDSMEAFIEERTERFVLGSREPVLNELLAHASATGGNGYVCLVGAPGSGKSALLAQVYRELTNPPQRSTTDSAASVSSVSFRGQPAVVIAHFVGASADSTDVRRTLRRFCHKLKKGCPEITADIPDDFEKLRAVFPDFLKQACAKKRVVILLDAANQFDATAYFGGLHWLPGELPVNARVILSLMVEPPKIPNTRNEGNEATGSEVRSPAFTRSDGGRPPEGGTPNPVLDELRRRRVAPRELELQPLTPADGEAIIGQFLKRYHKRFSDGQRAALLAKSDAGMPLYLLTALEELRTLGTYEEITRRIAEVPPTTQELFAWILERLENDDGFRDAAGQKIGKELVPRFAALLGASRHGLSQRELIDLLAPADPQGNVAALLHLLRPYLMRRGELLDFYHSQLKDAVGKRYLSDEAERIEVHKSIADYFETRWRDPSPHALTELPYHLTETQMWTKLAATLSEYDFVETKVAAGMAYGLVADFNAAAKAIPSDCLAKEEVAALSDWRWFVSARADQLAAHVETFFQTAFNYAADGAVAVAAQARASSFRTPWLRLLDRPHRSAGTRCLRVLRGHTNAVQAVAVTPDGHLAVSGGGAEDEPLELCVWDILSGQCLRMLRGENGAVSALAITPDGQSIVGAGGPVQHLNQPGKVWLWDLSSGALLKTLGGHTGVVSDIAVLPNGRRAVSAGYDNTVRVWDLEQGQCVQVLRGHTSWVECVVVTSDGTRAVSGGEDKTIRVWELSSGRCLRTMEVIRGSVCALAIMRDNRRIIAANPDSAMRGGWELQIWDTETGRRLQSLPRQEEQAPSLWDTRTGKYLAAKQHLGWITAIVPTPDEQQIVSASKDKTLRLWYLPSGTLGDIFCGHDKAVSDLAITPDGLWMISASEDRTVRIWTMQSVGVAPEDHFAHQGRLCSFAVTPDGQRAISASTDMTMRGWDLTSGENTSVCDVSSIDTRVGVLPDAQRALSHQPNGILCLWSARNLGCLKKVERHSTPVDEVVVTPDGLAILGHPIIDDETSRTSLGVWDLATGRLIRTLKGHEGSVSCVVLTPDGRQAISGGFDHTLRVWDLPTGHEVHVMKGHTDSIDGLVMMPRGNEVISVAANPGCERQELKIWNLLTGVCRITTVGRMPLTVTPDGVSFVWGGEDGSLNISDMETGRLSRKLAAHRCSVVSLAVSDDSQWLVSGALDGTVRIWNLQSGEPAGSLTIPIVPHYCVVASNAKRLAIGGDRDHRAGHVWTLELVNFTWGPVCVTAWRRTRETLSFWHRLIRSISAEGQARPTAFGCPFCRTWPEIAESALGTELACPNCGKAIKLNPFIVNADWRPIAKAWKGE